MTGARLHERIASRIVSICAVGPATTADICAELEISRATFNRARAYLLDRGVWMFDALEDRKDNREPALWRVRMPEETDAISLRDLVESGVLDHGQAAIIACEHQARSRLQGVH